MNLAEARAELSDRGFHYLGDSRLNVALNNGKNALEDEIPWPWLETTADGVSPLTIADLKYVLYVVDTTNDRQLLGVTARDVVDRDVDVSTAGVPDCWWLDGVDTIRTYPVNVSASLSVRYVRFSPELSQDSASPLIPERYHPVWVDYAAVEAYKDDDQFDAANALLNDVRGRRLPQMIEVFATRNRQNPGYQHVTFASEDW